MYGSILKRVIGFYFIDIWVIKMTPMLLFFMMFFGLEIPIIVLIIAIICDTILISIGMLTGLIHYKIA